MTNYLNSSSELSFDARTRANPLNPITALSPWFVKEKNCRLTKKSYLENFPPYMRNFLDNRATNIMDELQQIRYKKSDDRSKFTSKLLQLALTLRYSSLPAYPFKYAGPMRIFISKSDRHERVAAENVMICHCYFCVTITLKTSLSSAQVVTSISITPKNLSIAKCEEKLCNNSKNGKGSHHKL